MNGEVGGGGGGWWGRVCSWRQVKAATKTQTAIQCVQ